MFSGTTAFFTSVARQMPSAVVLCFLGMMRIVYAQEDARVITTVAGSGTYGFAGDGGPALEARIAAWGIAVDGNGNIYMSDPENSRVRKIDGQTGIISTSAGDRISAVWIWPSIAVYCNPTGCTWTEPAISTSPIEARQ